MNLQTYIQTIQIHLIQTHSEVLKWFDIDENIKHYRPKNNGWTIAEILEHIALTSHFLMILIDKSAAKAVRNTKQLSLTDLMENFDFDLSKIDAIGQHKSFEWIRPEHMEPKGEKSELEIKKELIHQLNRSLNHLENFNNGEGLLHKTTMTVNDLGKLNVYEYIYFLSKHAERHIQQMKVNKQAFLAII